MLLVWIVVAVHGFYVFGSFVPYFSVITVIFFSFLYESYVNTAVLRSKSLRSSFFKVYLTDVRHQTISVPLASVVRRGVMEALRLILHSPRPNGPRLLALHRVGQVIRGSYLVFHLSRE